MTDILKVDFMAFQFTNILKQKIPELQGCLVSLVVSRKEREGKRKDRRAFKIKTLY
jgi:hypothetical protein